MSRQEYCTVRGKGDGMRDIGNRSVLSLPILKINETRAEAFPVAETTALKSAISEADSLLQALSSWTRAAARNLCKSSINLQHIPKPSATEVLDDVSSAQALRKGRG